MSAPVNVLEAIDRNLKDRAERAARYGRKSDQEAARRGFRNPAGDRKADFERHLLEQLSASRAAVAELIDHVRSDRCFCHGEFVCTRCLVLKRVGAAS